MITFNIASFLFFLFPVSVLAHGFVGSVTIDGTTYQGNIPGGTTNPSVIRQVSTIDPVKGATNPSLNCGMNATEASDVANANPSSQILIYWVGGSTGDSNWPHNVGPIMHYMTKCSGSCSSYNSTNAEWFKISELGLETSDTWYQANLDVKEPANVTIPSNIQPGDYLLRSEIISLQLAVSVGGAEFYPACIQLSIGGSGTGAPQSSEVCRFPGCYTDTEAGIYTPNIYNPPINYTFPGPPVAAFVNGSSGSGSSSGSGTPSAAATTSPTPSAGSQTCKLVSRSSPTGIVVKRGMNLRTHKRRPARRWRY
ncbi:glycoside hydrolase family 61 protein [Pisolithus tinctorius]|uniref:lytic cellulose monooxygenase (C4-dehydrogenating) n=1 Tax=Pisolithus tinctorius Marx 270 TaxID=870435 RepID=A0A0C3NIL4_PISTI|nr:glycoside hydrolase family 61 protein [Pisolithus tinctorius]KIN95525.1 glycoside hydrolase family 61 protein [Pisolithus tinctorius Marx 270]